jgi:hypothetical protein
MRKFLLPLLLLIPFIISAQNDSIFISQSFGEFADGASVSASRGEYIFVSDIGSNKIYKFDIDGRLIATYGGTGLGKYELNQPVSIDASNGLDLFVCDYLNNRIVRLDSKLNFISLFDFNLYNSGIESQKKVYNPRSVTSVSTGELLLLCDAGNYKALRIREFNDINLYFGQSYDRILEPVKIVKGNSLDVWVLEKSTKELLNFNNLGIFVKKLKMPDELNPISITFAENYLIILVEGGVIYYDLKSGAYSGIYYFQRFLNLKDIVSLDRETIFILHKYEVFKFIIK